MPRNHDDLSATVADAHALDRDWKPSWLAAMTTSGSSTSRSVAYILKVVCEDRDDHASQAQSDNVVHIQLESVHACASAATLV